MACGGQRLEEKDRPTHGEKTLYTIITIIIMIPIIHTRYGLGALHTT